jgi:hypothetical protein
MVVRCFDPNDVGKVGIECLSQPPRSRAEFDSATEFVLGHFTSSTFLSNILKEGLQPDVRKERAVADNLPSDGESVYLSTRFDRYYLKRAIDFHGGIGILIDVQVLRSSLTADEEWLSVDQCVNLDANEALYRTMCGGSCRHVGPISLSHILSIRTTDGELVYMQSKAK